MMARPMVWPVEAPSACTTRATIRVAMPAAKIAAVVATVASASPARITGRRPKRSDSGPNSSCASASPSR